MTTMYDRIVKRCNELGYTPGGLCTKIGLRRAYITEIKNGKVKNLSVEKVSQLAAGLRVSCDYLINGVEFHDDLSKDEEELLNAWRRASISEKENVAFILRNYGVTVASEESELAV